jgi:hypothetical protein
MRTRQCCERHKKEKKNENFERSKQKKYYEGFLDPSIVGSFSWLQYWQEIMLSVTDMKNIYIYIRRVVPGVPRDTVRGVPQKTRSALPAIQIFALSNYELSFLFVGRHQNNLWVIFLIIFN